MAFWAYMLHCRAGVFYTGHTDDLDRRIAEHRSGLIPGITQNMHPLELVWSQDFPTRDEALAAERRIKGWSRKKKLALIRGDWDAVSFHARSKSGRSGSAAAPLPTGSRQAGLQVTREIVELLLAEAAAAHPHECCGLLLGHGTAIECAVPAANVHPQPARRFEIDPQALVDAHRAARDGGCQIVGYYHSHPTGIPAPSAEDRAQAAGDGRVWAIVAGRDVTFWRDDEAGFAALSYTVDER